MNHGDEPASRVVASVEQITWFAESRDTLEKIPAESQPSWYREFAGAETNK